MKPILILTTVFSLLLGMAAAEPRTFTGNGGELLKIDALSGNLILKGKMDSTANAFWFHLIFKNSEGRELFQMRLGDNQLLVPDNHGIGKLQKPSVAGENFTLKIHVAKNSYYAVEVDGYLQASFTAAPETGPCTVEIKPFNCSVLVEEATWTPDPNAKIEAVIRTYGKHMWNQLLAVTPEGNWQISCKFRPTRRNQENNHYGFTIDGDKNQPRLMIVIWEPHYQMIQGNNSKGLGKFDKPLNDNWHDFKLVNTDGNFFETFIDGKRGESFEAELTPGGDIRVYGMWDLEVKEFELTKLED